MNREHTSGTMGPCQPVTVLLAGQEANGEAGLVSHHLPPFALGPAPHRHGARREICYGVRRFVYVSVFRAEAYPRVAYLKAHADVAAELRRSGLGYAVIQPTGFFSAYAAFLEMARQGRGAVFGSGQARTNPIHDLDLAALCAEATLSDEDADLPAGGPEVHTRREVLELAFAALGRPPRIVSAPGWAPQALSGLIQPFAPRLGELMAFLGTVSADDFVAPARGTRRLADYFAARTATLQAPPISA